MLLNFPHTVDFLNAKHFEGNGCIVSFSAPNKSMSIISILQLKKQTERN